MRDTPTIQERVEVVAVERWAVVGAESGRDAKPAEPCSEGADGRAGGGGGQLCNFHPAGESVGVDQVSVTRMGEEVGAGN